MDGKHFVYPRKLFHDYYFPTDSGTVTIEYSDSSTYRFSQYPFLDQFKGKLDMMDGKIKRLFSLLKREFGYEISKNEHPFVYKFLN